MRSSLLAFALILILGSCADEEGAGLTNTSTFIRYFNGGADDVAETVLETPDQGYIILANSTIQPNEVTAPHYKIKLIKTDAFGNLEWQKVFPEYGNDLNGTVQISYVGHGLLILPDGGYVVVGEDINNGISQPLIMSIDATGGNFKKVTVPVLDPTTSAPINVVAKGVTLNNNGKLLVLSQSTDTMILSEFNTNPFTATPTWSRSYQAGQIDNLVSKIFLNTAGAVYLGGTVTRNNATTKKIRFIKTTQNSDIVDSDQPIGNPLFNETGKDICRFGFGFAVIGTTDEKSGSSVPGDQDILFRRLSDDGSAIPGQVKAFQLGGVENNGSAITDLKGSEEGNSIYATLDGGLILLGTVDSKVGTATATDSRGNEGRGEKDMYLIKIDPFGGVAWTQIYGSKFIDTGASVIQSSDGGFVVLGTSDISGTLKTIVMMKTDKDGKIE